MKIVFALLLLLSRVAVAATLTVSTNGNDAIGNPYRTFKAAFTNSASGDTIQFITDGTWSEPSNSWTIGNRTIRGTGTNTFLSLQSVELQNNVTLKFITIPDTVFHDDLGSVTNLKAYAVNFMNAGQEDIFRNNGQANGDFWYCDIRDCYAETKFDAFLGFFFTTMRNTTVVGYKRASGTGTSLAGLFRGDASTLENCTFSAEFVSFTNGLSNPLIQSATAYGVDWNEEFPYVLGTNGGRLTILNCRITHSDTNLHDTGISTFTVSGMNQSMTNPVDCDVYGYTNLTGFWTKNGTNRITGGVLVVSNMSTR